MDDESPQGCSNARTGQSPPNRDIGSIGLALNPYRDPFERISDFG